MANTTVLRSVGKTYAIAVTATSSTSVTINDQTNDQVNYATFLNVGSKPCAVNVSSLSTAPAAVFPNSTPGDFVLPANMNYPLTLVVPTLPFQITAICGGTDTTTIYVTPVGDQS
ncbi:hypothetical protein UFOVP96_2 [uncultured Caudovirales phage]|uniref:Uncharacterized protein n=1 Tax=uncultured Caudovirales phage TaxID=2100421 RepID=A0A6J5L388_9CAUD|nr:hypothetical protein UFOVP96_2 [uncultured Caudovirales phage]